VGSGAVTGVDPSIDSGGAVFAGVTSDDVVGSIDGVLTSTSDVAVHAASNPIAMNTATTNEPTPVFPGRVRKDSHDAPGRGRGAEITG
jgi:hypothetical protein